MPSPNTPSLSEAEIQWDENNQPLSPRFDDIYFSRSGGLDETNYVFMAQNALPERWRANAHQQDLQHSKNLRFTIGETGFGTGLNFLAAAHAWLTHTTSGTLHFVTVEKFPLSKPDLQQSLSLWPQLSEVLSQLTDELIQQYPPAVAGIHRIPLANNRIILTLMYGDAGHMFSTLKGSDHPLFQHQGNPHFDAWFLDGFAPSKNPDMWTEELFQTIGDLSHTGTTFSTFTAAGVVRRGLSKAGFVVEKVPGFGQKRDMLRGKIVGETASTTPTQLTGKDWQPATFNSPHQPPWYLSAPSTEKTSTSAQRAIVIGGGIAGCSTARALAGRGIAVTLIERHNKVGQEASGNPQGILYPKLSTSDSPLSRFGLMALLNASRYYSSLLDERLYGQRCGVLVLPKTDKDCSEFKIIAKRYPQELVQLLDGKALHDKAGLTLTNTMGLFFPQLGWIKPPTACQLLTEHPLIEVTTADVRSITRENGQWLALDNEELNTRTAIASADVMVIACGFDSNRFHQTNHLPLKRIRGQISQLPATRESNLLKTVLCGEGYIAPAQDGTHTLGATYNFDDDSRDVRTDDHLTNLRQLAATDQSMADRFPSLPAEQLRTSLTGRVAFRCTTPDYLPIAGPAPILDAYEESYKLLKKNARSHIPIAGQAWPGLYLNIGHGSRGLSYAPMCAELVASQIAQEAPPLELDLRRAIHPGRFIIRDLKRNKR